MADWTKETPGPGTYQCKGPNINEDGIVVEIYHHDAGLVSGLKVRVLKPPSYASLPPGLAVESLGHVIFKDAEWSPLNS